MTTTQHWTHNFDPFPKQSGGSVPTADLLTFINLFPTRREAEEGISAGAVRIDRKPIAERYAINANKGKIIRAGKPAYIFERCAYISHMPPSLKQRYGQAESDGKLLPPGGRRRRR